MPLGMFIIAIVVITLCFFIFYATVNQTPPRQDGVYYPRSNHSSRSNHSEYQQIIKSTSTCDNMNCDIYVFSGKYTETKRMRRNHIIYIFEDQSVKEAIVDLGYEEPIEFEKVDFEGPTLAQRDYLYDLSNGIVPDNVSLDDASALIDRYVEHDQIPNPQLFKYATQMHIPVSYYCGKKRLYNLIFSGLELRDQIAFFIFQVYRDSYDAYGSHDIANPNNSPYKQLFYDFAEQYLDDEKFIKSMQNYLGKNLRYFGKRTYNGYEIMGGSQNTIAYKAAKSFLQLRTEIV